MKHDILLKTIASVTEQVSRGDPQAVDIALKNLYGRICHGILDDLRAGRSTGDSEIWKFLQRTIKYASYSKGQIFQDLWVLYELKKKRDGYFVEFGAATGVKLSNTWMLENHFNWRGILAEPNPDFHKSLHANRKCHISFDCVYSQTGLTVPMHCTEISELSRMGQIVPADSQERKGKRNAFKIVEVSTVSLNDLLERFEAPRDIDYLSIDTEGSELDILSAFDFDRWNIKLITVEHNRTPMRKGLFDLLTSKGYRRKFESISFMDDWYIRG